MKKIFIILLAIVNVLYAQSQEQDSIISWYENDSVKMAPLQVERVGVDNYESLFSPKSSLDL